ncbi:MAG: hypothetical protein V1929_00040 [bacterium]
MPVEKFNQSVLVFLTICTKDRKRILASDLMHRRLTAAWEQAGNWLVGRYVVLPDHVHLFCAPGSYPVYPLGRWIAYWKRLVTQSAPDVVDGSVWQQNYWDTQLRRGESYSAKWEYVRCNPVRHGLVSSAEDWPWQGEMNRFMWHD